MYQAFVIPRGKLNEIHEYDEMSRPGIYFLFGDGVEKEKVYIGQTNNLASRLSQHDTDRESEAWNKAICFAGHLDAYSSSILRKPSYWKGTRSRSL